MSGRANRGLVAAAIAAGVLTIALATFTRVRCVPRHETTTSAFVHDRTEGADLEDASAAASGSRTARSVTLGGDFVSEPVFGDHMTIIALDEDGEPVPGAEIHIHEPAQSYWDLAEPTTAFERDPLGEVRRRGTKYTCDEVGRVRLPRPSGWSAVLATSGGSGGFDGFPPGTTSPWFIELEPQRTLEVRAWDERGAPVADLPVEVHESDHDSLWRGVTGADGRVMIESVAFGLQCPDEVVVVTAGVPSDPLVERWVRRDFADACQVDLVVPNGAVTTVRVVDAQGRLLDVNGDMGVYFPRRRPRANCETKYVMVPLRHGLAVIRGIPAQCPELTLAARSVNATITPLSSGLWPAVIDVRPDDGDRLVRFTASDAEGKALANRHLEWGHTAFDEGELKESLDDDVVTDGRGEFSCFVYCAEPGADGDEGEEAGGEVFELVDAAAHPPLRGAVDFELLRAWRASESFTVTLAPIPLALGGRVVDEHGFPLVHAKVEARRLVGLEFEGLRTFTETYTDAHGRFEVFAVPTSAPLGLCVLVDGSVVHTAEPSSTSAFGTKDIELRVRSWGTIEGRLLIDRESRDRCFEVTAMKDDVEHGRFDGWSVGTGLHWRVQGLEEGTYSVRVVVDGAPLLAIDGVRVAKSGLTLDARCLPIDLRGRLPAQAPDPGNESSIRTLRLVDTHGAPIEHGVWRYQYDDYWYSWRPWIAGEVTVLAQFERIAVFSPGFTLRELAAPERDSACVLEPERTVDVTLRLPPALCSNRLEWRATAELGSETNHHLAWMLGSFEPKATFDPSGRATFRFPVGGSWLVHVIAVWRTDDQENACALERFEIRCRGERAHDTVALEPDPERWLENLREVGAPVAAKRD